MSKISSFLFFRISIYASVLSSYINSLLNLYGPAVTTIIYYVSQAIRVRIRFSFISRYLARSFLFRPTISR
jgi:hypothetical protein